MEETVIVIMLKEKQTGFLEKELGCYDLGEQQNIILNIYAEETAPDITTVFLKLTCQRDVQDWEYDAILDYYDMDSIKPFVDTIEEVFRKSAGNGGKIAICFTSTSKRTSFCI